MSDHRPQSDDRRGLRQIGLLSTVGLTLVISTLLGTGAGYYLDGRLGTSPWLTVVGLLLGGAAGFVNLFRTVSALDREQKP